MATTAPVFVPWSDGGPTHMGPGPGVFTTSHKGLQENCTDPECQEEVAAAAAEAAADALFQARLADAETIPVTVVRHQCPHCRATRAHKVAARRHVARCYRNPAVRSCRTCEHHIPADFDEHAGPAAEACDARPYQEQPKTFPAVDCPLWQLRSDLETERATD